MYHFSVAFVFNLYCLHSWDLNRSLHPCANYCLIISAHQNPAFQLPLILFWACQVTSPFPSHSRCIWGSMSEHFLILHPVYLPACILTPSLASVWFLLLRDANRFQGHCEAEKHNTGKWSPAVSAVIWMIVVQSSPKRTAFRLASALAIEAHSSLTCCGR